jgi:hypothetical protein
MSAIPPKPLVSASHYEPVLDDDAEGDGDHRQVGPAHAQRREGEDDADSGAEDGGKRQRHPEPEAEPRGQDRARVRAERVEPRLPERHLPR